MARYVQQKIPARKVEGLMAVITVKSSEIHRLNELGTAIWDQCEGDGATPDAIVAALIDVYEVAPVQLREDVVAFLEDACVKGLLSRVP